MIEEDVRKVMRILLEYHLIHSHELFNDVEKELRNLD